MNTTIITASKAIDAPAKRIYDIIADYRNGHPTILPKPYFLSLNVEKGGYGEGTMINFQMKLFGQVRTSRAQISEPEPGRILQELDPEGTVKTLFTVDPMDGGAHTHVTITTELKTRPGVAGKLEGYLAKMMLKRVYAEELELLANRATSGAGNS